ncbi:MAG: histidinol-phosphatase, partial [Kiritimatiellia bacterium]
MKTGETAGARRWYRGQLHAHSYWSDGRGFPEQALVAYRRQGYSFVCLSEHNRFADNPDEWRE